MISLRILFEQWVHRYSYSTELLATFRILFALYTLCGGIIPNLRYTADFPNTFYVPPLGIAMLMQSFPSEWLATVLLAVGYVLCGCVLIGFYTRIASLALSIHLFLCYAIT
jgi:uncharacterized membrane protein YphA (DoxX/SURF4 family)